MNFWEYLSTHTTYLVIVIVAICLIIAFGIVRFFVVKKLKNRKSKKDEFSVTSKKENTENIEK